MKKAVKITMLIAVGLVVLGMGMVFVSLAAGGFDIKNVVQTVNYTEKTFDIDEEVTDIDIRISSQNLQIKQSEDERTRFVCYESDREIYEAVCENGTLRIESQDIGDWKSRLIVFDLKEAPCVLYLPKEEYGNLSVYIGSGEFTCTDGITFKDAEIENGSGDIFIERLNADDVSAKVHSGSLTIKKLACNSAELSTGSGSIDVSESEVKGLLKGKSGSGSILLDTIECEELDFKTGSGSVKASNVHCAKEFKAATSSGGITLTDVVSDDEFNAKTGSGSIKLEACDGANMDLKTSSGSVKGSVKTVKMFNASSGAGSISVPDDDPTGGKCIIYTGSGSIEITIAE